MITYWDASSTDLALRVVKCGNISCSSGNEINTVESGRFGEYNSLSIGADGFPIISYYDYANGNLKVAHCGDVSCSSGNTITTLDSAGDVGLYTSIVIGSDNLPIISYYDATNYDLKTVKCAKASCSVD